LGDMQVRAKQMERDGQFNSNASRFGSAVPSPNG
jgi:hypothetical protein